MLAILTAYAIVAVVGVIIALVPMWVSWFGDDPEPLEDLFEEPLAN